MFIRLDMILLILIRDWNDNLKADLNRCSFDSIVKILELNTGNKITIIVERMNSRFLKEGF